MEHKGARYSARTKPAFIYAPCPDTLALYPALHSQPPTLELVSDSSSTSVRPYLGAGLTRLAKLVGVVGLAEEDAVLLEVPGGQRGVADGASELTTMTTMTATTTVAVAVKVRGGGGRYAGGGG